MNTLEQARHDYDLDDLATKRDMKDMEVGLRRDMKEMELKLQKEIAETKADLIRWVVGVGLLQIAIIAGLIFRLTSTI